MEPTRIVNKICYYIPKEKLNQLEILFQKAEYGDWDAVSPEILKDPTLLNATFESGPNRRKTILWIAAHRLAEKQDVKVLEFLEPIFKSDQTFDLDAYPDAEEGKSVFWLLSFALESLYSTVLVGDYSNFCYALNWIGKTYSNCNINIAPKEGPYKGVTAALLLSRKNSAGWKIINAFNPSFIAYSEFEGSISTLLSMAKNLCYHEEDDLPDLVMYSKLLLKMLEDCPTCNVNIPYGEKFPGNPLELVMCSKGYPDQNKVIFYLILCGAEFRNYKSPIDFSPEYKEKYDNAKDLIQKLTTTFKAASAFYLKSDHFIEEPLPQELKQNIALKMITDHLPDLQDVPRTVLLQWLTTFPQKPSNVT